MQNDLLFALLNDFIFGHGYAQFTVKKNVANIAALLTVLEVFLSLPLSFTFSPPVHLFSHKHN